MAVVLLFHAILGVRASERALAGRLRAAGHRVILPDLYGGEMASGFDEGFALRDRIGWEEILRRAEAVEAPKDAVLAGFSMGCSVAAHLWAARPETARVLFLNGVAEIPEGARAGLPFHLHLAEPDPFEDEQWVTWTRETAAARGLRMDIHRYPGAGHLFADPDLPGADPAAAEAMLRRATDFVGDAP